MIINEWRSFSYWSLIIDATYMSLGFRFELGWAGAKLVYSSDIDKDLKVFHETTSFKMLTLQRYVDASPHWGDPARQSVASLAHALSPVLEEHESRQGDGKDLSLGNKSMAKVRWPMKASWREKELMPGLLYRIGSRWNSMPESVRTTDDHYFGLFCFFQN